MKYFDDFFDKYSFGDGGDVPADAPAHRELIVKAVNYAAAELGSNFRLAHYNRAGMHNGLMLVFLSKACFEDREKKIEAGKLHYHDLNLDHAIWQASGTDDAMQDAVSFVSDMDVPLEEFIDIDVKVRRGAAMIQVRRELRRRKAVIGT